MPFTFTKVEQIPDLIIIQPRVFPDERGFFLETFKKSDFLNENIDCNFVQDNHSQSKKNVIRGLHYQLPPYAQGKLIRVLNGEIYDIAVDIRKNSPTFKKWFGIKLSSEKQTMFYIPPGFAHGFAALTDKVDLMYKCTNEYNPDSEAGIRWDDPDLNVDWGIKNPILSSQDNDLPYLKNAKLFD